MTCNKCDQDLKDCTCADLPERWKSIKACQFLYVHPLYAAEIQAQANKRLAERASNQKDNE